MRQLKTHEKNYLTHELELIAIVFDLTHDLELIAVVFALNMDVKSLINSFVRLDILKLSRVLASVKAQTLLVEQIKARKIVMKSCV